MRGPRSLGYLARLHWLLWAKGSRLGVVGWHMLERDVGRVPWFRLERGMGKGSPGSGPVIFLHLTQLIDLM